MLSLEALIFIIYIIFVIYNLLFQAGRGIVFSAALFATPAQKVEHNLDICCPLLPIEATGSIPGLHVPFGLPRTAAILSRSTSFQKA